MVINMHHNTSASDPDYYLKRSQTIQQNDYSVEVLHMDFTQSDSAMIRWHWHDEIELDYIAHGQTYITCDEHSFLAKEGDLVFINQNTKHFFTPAVDEGYILKPILVHPKFIFGFGQLDMEKKYITPVLHHTDLRYLHLTPSDALYDSFIVLTKQILQLNEAKTPGYELLTKAAILQLWKLLYDVTLTKENAPAAKSTLQDEQRVKQAILYIQEHFTESISLDDIASSILVSKSECCRCFKRTLRVTPFEYLMKYRITESTKRMHRKSQESISEIASSVGFNNTSYYNKIFKKYMNCTPTEYRNSIKPNISMLP